MPNTGSQDYQCNAERRCRDVINASKHAACAAHQAEGLTWSCRAVGDDALVSVLSVADIWPHQLSQRAVVIMLGRSAELFDE